MKLLSQAKPNSLKWKTCVLRVDFNVESATDALRLEASLPTLKYLLKVGCRILMISHRGRPKGVDPKFSLKPFVPFLKKNLREEVVFLTGLPGSLSVRGKVFLMENLRFWQEEDDNDEDFAKHLAKLGDFYVNDAFAVCHRKNASITQLPRFLPSYAGLLLEKEIATLTAAAKKPKKPLVVVLGGAKMEDKVPVMENLLPRAHKVLIGSSIIGSGVKLPKSDKILTPADWLGEGGKAFDIGPLTWERYAAEIKKAKTIIWNGPLGWFEKKPYRGGSVAVAKAIASSKAFSVVGGGETAQLVLESGLRKQFGFLSTGGGAMLEFLSGKKLPGIEALK